MSCQYECQSGTIAPSDSSDRPGAPRDLQIVTTGTNQGRISWGAPDNASDEPIMGYWFTVTAQFVQPGHIYAEEKKLSLALRDYESIGWKIQYECQGDWAIVKIILFHEHPDDYRGLTSFSLDTSAPGLPDCSPSATAGSLGDNYTFELFAYSRFGRGNPASVQVGDAVSSSTIDPPNPPPVVQNLETPVNPPSSSSSAEPQPNSEGRRVELSRGASARNVDPGCTGVECHCCVKSPR